MHLIIILNAKIIIKIKKNDIVKQILSLFFFFQSRRFAGPHDTVMRKRSHNIRST